MKKIAYTILLLILVLTLSACSANYERYAKKINRAAERDDYYTYSEVVEELGKPAEYLNGPHSFVEGPFGFDAIQTNICVWRGQNGKKSLWITFEKSNAVKAEVK